ncbi:hypothetical protein JW906_04340, partial [bacterium]|nr:hypothetical protein [bacterium]
MKKRLMFCVIALMAIPVMAGVDIRLVKISDIQNFGGTNTLVVAVEGRSSHNYYLSKLQGAFYIGDGLNAVLTSCTPLDAGELTNANYNKNHGESNGVVHFQYLAKDEDDGPYDRILPLSTWQELVRYTFVYPYTQSSTTTFRWDQNEDYGFVAEVWFSTLGIPLNVNGIQVNIPADLQDMSLPVEMTDFTAMYSYERGVSLNWATQSEVNSAGFHILRAEDPDGEFERVTREMIPGQGNSSSLTQYS